MTSPKSMLALDKSISTSTLRHIIIILLCLIITKNLVAQKYMFSATGSMQYSRIFVDTVIKSTLKINGRTVFNYLDSTYNDTLNIRRFFTKKYDFVLQDTLEYFFVANLTSKEISFNKLNNRLVAEEFGRYENYGFKPFSFFVYPNCGTGIDYTDLVLKPTEILIIKNLTKRQSSKTEGMPNCFMKLLIGANGVLFSKRYAKPVDEDSFYINSDLEEVIMFNRLHLAFKEK